MLDFTIHSDDGKLNLILKEIRKMIVELEDLKLKVTNLQSASEAAVNLLNLIKTKLDEAIANASSFEELRAGVVQVTQAIEQEGKDLADAVVANTPAG